MMSRGFTDKILESAGSPAAPAPMVDDDARSLKMLQLYLEHVDSAFVTIEVNSPVRQLEIIDSIKAGLETLTARGIHKRLHVVDLKDLSYYGGHFDEVKRHAMENPDAILAVINLHLAAKGVDEDEARLVVDLNFSRELYHDLERVIIFFFPIYFMDLVIGKAPDFYDFVQMKFKFGDGTATSAPPMGTMEMMSTMESTGAIEATGGYEDVRHLKNRASFLNSVLETYNLTDGERVGKLIDLAGVYDKLYDYETALKLYRRALDIDLRVFGGKRGEGATLNNIGRIYHARGDYDTALKYLLDSLKICREIGDKRGEGVTLNNISQIYHARGDYDTALKYILDSLKICREIGDKRQEGVTLFNIAMLYRATNEPEKAGEYIQKVVEINATLKDYELTQALTRALAGIGIK